jgi:Tfp pilus assembly protein PilF
VLHKAVTELERAVALDTNFAPAWAMLAVARTRLFENSGSLQRSDLVRAKFAAERALALDSTLPNARAAMAGYYSVGENDQPRAIRELRAGLRTAPRDPSLLTLVSISERILGQWDAAVGHLQQALAIDPRDATVLYDLGVTYFVLRRFPEAREAALRAVAIDPGPQNWQLVAMIALANGDLSAGRAVMTRAGQTIDATTLVTFVATYGDLYWALDDAQRALLLRLTPASFGDDHFNWSYAEAGMSWLAGDSAAMRAFADTALREGEASARNDPTEPQNHALVGVANAYLGHREAAVREGELAVTLCPVAKDALTGVYVLQQLARIYVMVGDDDRAVAALTTLLRVPSYVSQGWLRIDPTFAPLKRSAAFRRLIGARG